MSFHAMQVIPNFCSKKQVWRLHYIIIITTTTTMIIITCQAENKAQAEHLPSVSKNQSSILTAKKPRKSLVSVKMQSTLVTRTTSRPWSHKWWQEASKKVLVCYSAALSSRETAVSRAYGSVYLHSLTVEADGLCQSRTSPRLGLSFWGESSGHSVPSIMQHTGTYLKMSQLWVKSYPHQQFLLSEKGLTLITNCGGLNINDSQGSKGRNTI